MKLVLVVETDVRAEVGGEERIKSSEVAEMRRIT
jgi:hypothetical protein